MVSPRPTIRTQVAKIVRARYGVEPQWPVHVDLAGRWTVPPGYLRGRWWIFQGQIRTRRHDSERAAS